MTTQKIVTYYVGVFDPIFGRLEAHTVPVEKIAKIDVEGEPFQIFRQASDYVRLCYVIRASDGIARRLYLACDEDGEIIFGQI